METRDYFNLYTEVFSTVVRSVSLFPINHPMDAIFFQSGIAALLSTFTKRFLTQHNADYPTAQAGFVLTMICPFLMMNGGVILLRDTFVAGLLIYSLCCMNLKRWPLAIGALILLIMIRPGTALILLPVYYIIYLPNFRNVDRRRFVLFFIGLPTTIIIGLSLVAYFSDFWAVFSQSDQITLTGRQIFDDLTANDSANRLFLAIQRMPFLIKFFLSGIYIYLYPFFSPKTIMRLPFFDLRMYLMSIIIPLQAFWLNGWFIAGMITRAKVFRQQRQVAAAFLVAILLIGTYSLQTRHKTIVYPLYYCIIAVGFRHASKSERKFGYFVSGGMLAAQVIVAVVTT